MNANEFIRDAADNARALAAPIAVVSVTHLFPVALPIQAANYLFDMASELDARAAECEANDHDGAAQDWARIAVAVRHAATVSQWVCDD